MHKIQDHYGNNKHNISEGAYGKKKIEIHITLNFVIIWVSFLL